MADPITAVETMKYPFERSPFTVESPETSDKLDANNTMNPTIEQVVTIVTVPHFIIFLLVVEEDDVGLVEFFSMCSKCSCRISRVHADVGKSFNMIKSTQVLT